MLKTFLKKNHPLLHCTFSNYVKHLSPPFSGLHRSAVTGSPSTSGPWTWSKQRNSMTALKSIAPMQRNPPGFEAALYDDDFLGGNEPTIVDGRTSIQIGKPIQHIYIYIHRYNIYIYLQYVIVLPLVSRNGQKSTPKLIMKLRFRYISFDLWQHLLAKTLQDGTLSQYLRCAHTLETYDISYDDTYITNNLHSSTEQYYCNSTLFMSTLDIASPKHAASSAATAMAILKKKYDQHEANQHQGNVKLGNLVQDKTISSRCQLKLTWTHPKGCHFCILTTCICHICWFLHHIYTQCTL